MWVDRSTPIFPIGRSEIERHGAEVNTCGSEGVESDAVDLVPCQGRGQRRLKQAAGWTGWDGGRVLRHFTEPLAHRRER